MCLNKEVESLCVKMEDYSGLKVILHSLIKRARSSYNEETLNKYCFEIMKHCVSDRQRGCNKDGQNFEQAVELLFLDYDIPYKPQVYLNDGGTIIGWNHDVVTKEQKRAMGILSGAKKYTVDFVIGDNINIGDSVSDYYIVSCKRTIRERGKQENKLHLKPRTFFLLTLSSETVKDTQIQLVSSNPNMKKNRKCIDFNLFFSRMSNEFK